MDDEVIPGAVVGACVVAACVVATVPALEKKAMLKREEAGNVHYRKA